jgi:hypothetical protein
MLFQTLCSPINVLTFTEYRQFCFAGREVHAAFSRPASETAAGTSVKWFVLSITKGRLLGKSSRGKWPYFAETKAEDRQPQTKKVLTVCALPSNRLEADQGESMSQRLALASSSA